MSLAHTLPCRPVRLGALDWLALHALALWPHGLYLVQRAVDGSDDPLGLLALRRGGRLVVWHRHRPAADAAPGLARRLDGARARGQRRLVGRCAGTVELAAGRAVAGVRAARVVAGGAAAAPLAGPGGAGAAVDRVAAVLSRLSAARAHRAAQRLGLAAGRLGRRAQRRVDGGERPTGDRRRAVFGRADGVARVLHRVRRRRRARPARPRVHAPRRVGRRDRAAGNVLRNSVLVALESRPAGPGAAWHEAIGLVVLAAVCAAVFAMVQREGDLHA